MEVLEGSHHRIGRGGAWSLRRRVVLFRFSEMSEMNRRVPGLLNMGDGWKRVAVFPPPELLELKGATKHETFTLYRREVSSP
jgi:hypothetical protein